MLRPAPAGSQQGGCRAPALAGDPLLPATLPGDRRLQRCRYLQFSEAVTQGNAERAAELQEGLCRDLAAIQVLWCSQPLNAHLLELGADAGAPQAGRQEAMHPALTWHAHLSWICCCPAGGGQLACAARPAVWPLGEGGFAVPAGCRSKAGCAVRCQCQGAGRVRCQAGGAGGRHCAGERPGQHVGEHSLVQCTCRSDAGARSFWSCVHHPWSSTSPIQVHRQLHESCNYPAVTDQWRWSNDMAWDTLQAHEVIARRKEELAAARIQKRHNEEYEVSGT